MLAKLGVAGMAAAKAEGLKMADRLRAANPGLIKHDDLVIKRFCYVIIDLKTTKVRNKEHTSNLTSAQRNPPVCSATGDLFKHEELEMIDGFKFTILHHGLTVAEAKLKRPDDWRRLLDQDGYAMLETEQSLLRTVHHAHTATFPGKGSSKGRRIVSPDVDIDFLTRAVNPGNPGCPDEPNEASAVLLVELPRDAASVDFSDRAREKIDRAGKKNVDRAGKKLKK